jgi:hypothetical protein
MLVQKSHAAGGANGSIMVEVFPSEREFFVPAGTD